MSYAKRLLEQQQGGRRNRAGLHFMIDDPEVSLSRKGVYAGVSGMHMLKSEANIKEYNAALEKWGRSVAGKLKRKQPSIAKSVRFKRDGGEIYAIGFGLLRHGVFLEKGVGRGYAYNGGSVVNKSGGAVKRKPKPWFNPTLDDEIPRLTEIVTRHTGDAININTKRMFIQ
jgi:hypothetical protein